MTQMLLFDPANPTESTAVLDPPVTEQTPLAPTNIAALVDHQSGLHHMGDLARLVLLRYDLVARRRAAMAARQAKVVSRSCAQYPPSGGSDV